MQRISLCLLTAGLCLPFVACGGSSGGGGGGVAVTGLAPPGGVSVVVPLEAVAPPGSLTPGAVDDFPAAADYFSDETSVFVYDPAIEPLETINMILCFMEQTAPQHMVNQGPYNAQINVEVCEQGLTPDSSDGQTSGSADELALWVVDSIRASNVLPQSVHVWAPQEEDFGMMTIYVDASITAPPSPTNPLGIFDMDFAGVDDAGGTLADPVFFGHLAATQGVADTIGLEFYEELGDVTVVQSPGEASELVQVNLQLNADQTQGVAKIHRDLRWHDGISDSGIVSEDYLVAFDETHFMRSIDGGADVAYERESFNENVWRYNLYTATGPDAGERVELNSSFGFTTSTGVYGNIGYYGLWVPDGTTVADGDLVTKEVYGDDSSGDMYEIVRAPGKLIQNSLESFDLSDIDGESFEWWDSSVLYLIQNSGGIWSRTASYDDVAEEWDAIVPPTVIDTGAAEYLSLWSDALGSVSFVDGDSFITGNKQEYVNGAHPLFVGETEIVLYGYINTLDNDITGSEADAGDVFMADSTSVVTPHVFRFLLDDLTLYFDVDGTGTTLLPVGLATGEEPTEGPNLWGMSSGPMLTSTAGLTDVWETWSQPTYFTYETGHNEWNQYTTAKDLLGDFVEFDAPVQFAYTHATANDRNADATYDGKTYLLEYGGPGDLWGMPFVGVDLDGDLDDDRWYPEFSLADEVEMGPTGAEYVVKAIDVEQTLEEDLAYTGTLTTVTAGALVLPDVTGYTVPNIGTKPVVDEAPRVIEGELIGAGTE